MLKRVIVIGAVSVASVGAKGGLGLILHWGEEALVMIGKAVGVGMVIGEPFGRTLWDG